ncbi:MAG TPA: NAD(P)/FAD-dependent oxidoreductase, partial [Nitrolancea sp.]|nr:NAD(P)/FAD-dependent oxidoreductase [Nitrolancea sp.]
MADVDWTRPDAQPVRRILILGGGFAGVYAALNLQRTLGGLQAEVAIVNRENFFVFYPLLPEILSGSIETESVLNPIRLVVPKVTLYVGEVTGIDLAHQRAEIRHGLYRHYQEPRTLYYDHLIVALGGVPKTAGIPGLADYAFDVQRLSHAFALRNHLIDTLEQADIETDPDRKRRLLTFVIAGGGANGVEVAAHIRDLVFGSIRYYQNIEPGNLHVILIHGGNRLISDLPSRLGYYAERFLRRRGVEILFNCRVARVEPDAVYLKNGEVIMADTIVGSVGVTPNPMVTNLPVPHDRRGAIVVNNDLSVPGYPNVWALGDNASVVDPHTEKPYPLTAQTAVREAKLVARNIAASLRGEPLTPFSYRTIGAMVALGHRSAVAYIRGLTFSGFIAWWLYRTYYLLQLPRWDKRLRIVF